LLLVESDDDGDSFSQALERFLFSTGLVTATYISASCPAHLKRTIKDTLSAPQKVGRTVENVVLSSNHKDILTPHGYETH
jgi:hypothetical protein